MATEPIINIEDWLGPIPGDNPSGANLAYQPEYDTIRQARRSEDGAHQGDWKREAKVADWSGVIATAERCMRTKTKDLQIAAWVTEALLRLYGFAGLRDGLTLLREINTRFWDSYYPEIDEGDLEPRFGPFVFLNDPPSLPYLIRCAKLTRGQGEESYSFESYEKSRETENVIKKNPEKSEAILKANVSAKAFDDQVAQTPRAYYEVVVDDLRQAIAAFRALEEDTDTRFGANAPSLLNIGAALDACLRFLEPILAAKRLKEPDQQPEPARLVHAAAAPIASVGDDPASYSRTNTVVAPHAANDPGRLLIDFRSVAQRLADAGAKLEQNRKKYAQLEAELQKLDAEYREISREFIRDGETYQLLADLVRLPL